MDTGLLESVLQFGIGGAFLAFLILQDRYYKAALKEKDAEIARLHEARVGDIRSISKEQSEVIGRATVALNRVTDVVETRVGSP